MVDYPYPCGFMSVLPADPVAVACELFRTATDVSEAVRGWEAVPGTAASAAPADELVGALVGAVLLYVNGSADLPCWDLEAELVGTSSNPASAPHGAGPPYGSSDLGTVAWNYQAVRKGGSNAKLQSPDQRLTNATTNRAYHRHTRSARSC